MRTVSQAEFETGIHRVKTDGILSAKGDPDNPVDGDKRYGINEDGIQIVEYYDGTVGIWRDASLRVGSGSVKVGDQVSLSDTGGKLTYSLAKNPDENRVGAFYTFSESGEIAALQSPSLTGAAGVQIDNNDGTTNYDATLVGDYYKLSTTITAPSNILVWRQKFRVGTTAPNSPVRYQVYEDVDNADITKRLIEVWLPVSLWDGKVAGDYIEFCLCGFEEVKTPIEGIKGSTYTTVYESEEAFSLYGDTSIYDGIIGQAFEFLPVTTVFGTEYEAFESLGESSSTSTWSDKIDATTATKPAGTYRIEFSCEGTTTNPSEDLLIRFMVDGSPIHNHTSGNNEIQVGCISALEWKTIYGKHIVTLSSPATIDLNMQFKDSTFGRISNAIIEIWRVS